MASIFNAQLQLDEDIVVIMENADMLHTDKSSSIVVF